MTLAWRREQRATIADMECWRMPTASVITYAAHDIEIARRDAARARSRRRHRLAAQIATAIGWYR